MSVFRKAAHAFAKLRRDPGKNPPCLCKEELHSRWKRNAKLIAAAACLLIAADAVSSSGGGDVRILQEKGRIYLVRPASGEETGHITLRAAAGRGESLCTRDLDISLLPQQSGEKVNGAETDPSGSEIKSSREETAASAKERILSELSRVGDSFNDDTSSRRVLLPGQLEGGETIRWSVRRSNHLLTILLLALSLTALSFHQRFSPLKKEAERRRESVLRDLPEFVNQLVLLLGAGMVLTAAFEQTVKENRKSGRKSYFYANLENIRNSLQTTNASFVDEFRRFAKTAGVSELIRVSNIISDNISKGAALTEKLRTESDMLWNRRKTLCEERGRLSETKMTLPLSIFLCVLIVITVAPALIER